MRLESLESRHLLSLPDWTVVLYMAADDKGPGDDLTLSRVNEVAWAIDRMPAGGSSASVNIVAQIDSIGDPAVASPLFGGATGTRRGEITSNAVPDGTWGTGLGNVDSGDRQTLIDFVQWTTANYPAEHYALILWGNGEGFDGVCRDDTSGSILSMSELAQVMDAIPHMDLVGFDAGLMGMVEVAAQLRGEADVMVASEADIPTPNPVDPTLGYIGFDYGFLSDLQADPDMTAATLATDIVTHFGDYYSNPATATPPARNAAMPPIANLTLAAVDLAQLGDSSADLVGALADFSDVMLTTATAVQADWNFLAAARNAATKFGDGNRDLGEMMTNLRGAYTAPNPVRTAADAVFSAIGSAVLSKYGPDYAAAGGLSIYSPKRDEVSWSADYTYDMSLLVDTQWMLVAAEFGPSRSPGVYTAADPLAPGQTAVFVFGTPGDDRIGVSRNNNRIFVGASFLSRSRNFSVWVSRVYVFAGDGDDTITVSSTVSRRVGLFGGRGNDTLSAGAGNDLLVGGPGDDVLRAGSGNDVVVGGDGDDRLDGAQGNDRLFGGDGNDTIYGGAGNDVLVGGNGDDALWGDAGNDVIVAGWGNDVLDESTGSNLLLGGVGDDVIYGGKNNDLIYTGDGRNIVYGDAGNDRIYGGDGDDILYGDAGHDIIFGGGGDDQIFGGSGRNLLIGGSGADKVFSQSGQDIVIGGTTTHDGDDFALRAILAEWARAKVSRSVRIGHIANTQSGGRNGTTFLRAGIDVFADVVANDLYYVLGPNWLVNYAHDRLHRTSI
jgi:Ca2+-binding RTX toxin-like protein